MSQRSDDYKPLNFYKKHAPKVKDGASKFEEGGSYWFAWFKNGEIELISEDYTSAAGRDNGIKSVSKNMKLPARYKILKTDSGKHYYDIMAGNGQSVATSVWKTSAKSAKAWADYMAGNGSKPQAASKAKAKPTPAKASAKPKATNNEDDYRPLAFFQKHVKGRQDGIYKFKGDDGEYYFTYHQNGQIVLISEGYPTTAARDTGAASVLKNLPNEARYKYAKMKNGKHEFRLHAGNGKEIARSVWYGSAAGAVAGAANVMGKKSIKSAAPAKTKAAPKTAAKPAPKAASKAKAAPKARARNTEDDYRPLAFYTKQTKGSPDGIEKFKGEDGEFYFTYNENGKIAMISEGYPTSAARDTGAASVLKNRTIEKRYSYHTLKNGKHDFRLKAANGREIARSVWYGSAAAAATGAAYVMGKQMRAAAKPKPKPKPKATPKAKPAVKKAAPVAAAAAVVAGAVAARPKQRKDDDYLRCSEYHNRPVTDAQNNVAEFTHKNGFHYFAVYDSDGDVRLRSEGFPNKAARQSELNAVIRNIDNKDRYKEVTNGEYTMDVLYDEDGREIGRSCLGKVAPAVVAPAAVAPVAAAAAPVAAATTAGGGGFGWLKWLIPLLLLLALALFGLSKCNDGKAALAAKQAEAAKVAADAKAAAEAKAAAAAKKAADMKAAAQAKAAEAARAAKLEADKVAAAAAAVIEVPKAEAKPAARPASTVRPVSGALNACGYSDIAIFNVPTSETPVAVSRLGTYPEFGDSHGLTPAQFFAKLESKYNGLEQDRQYLDYLFKSMGYAGGFKDADASIVSDVSLPYGTAGLLGLGVQHHFDYNRLNVTDPRDLEAFKLESRNDKVIHFMKTCGNYMYACE